MRFRVVLLVWLMSRCASAQLNEHGLKRRYRTTADGAFILKPGVTVTAVFDLHNQACTLTLRGAATEDQVLHYFDVLVPNSIRGAKRSAEPFVCVNICEHTILYQNVTLTTGVTETQKTDPAAIITFNRVECNTAVAEANKTVLNIKK